MSNRRQTGPGPTANSQLHSENNHSATSNHTTATDRKRVTSKKTSTMTASFQRRGRRAESEDSEESDESEEDDDDDEDDDDVPSRVARSWKAKNRVKSLSEEVEDENEWDPMKTPKSTKGANAKHPSALASSSSSSDRPRPTGSHSNASSNASSASVAAVAGLSLQTVAAASVPPTSNPPLASPIGNGTGTVDYQSLPYNERLEYERNYSRKWKVPLELLIDQVLMRYRLPPKQPTESKETSLTHQPHHRLQHSVSMVDTYSSRSEEFDAEISPSPMGSFGYRPPHRRSNSNVSGSSSPSSLAALARVRDEAERHSLAKGKLKIQAALLRKKQLDWQRRVEAGETTWEELEANEREEEERRRQQHETKHREVVSRIIDPRDRSKQRQAEEEAKSSNNAVQTSIEWYWNSIPIGAVAIMRLLVHTHAFDACLPIQPFKANGDRKKNDPTQKPELCRTWILSDMLYAIRAILYSIVTNEPELASTTSILSGTPRAASLPTNGFASSPHSGSNSSPPSSSTSTQLTGEQVQARLCWMMNNLVVLMHLTKRLAIQRYDEIVEARNAIVQGGAIPIKRQLYTPTFTSPPSEWPSIVSIQFPSMLDDGTPSQPLSALSSDVGTYVFDKDEDDHSDNPYHWFYTWLLRFSRVAGECLLQHFYTSTSLHTLRAESLLQPSTLVELGSEVLDSIIESLTTIYEQLTQARFMNLLKTQLLQALLDQFARNVMRVILTDPHIRKNGTPSSNPMSQRLLAHAVPLGMKLSMIYSCLEDWSQRCTAFAHPFVQSTRLTLAPLKEACLFCLLDDKSDLVSLESFQVLAPSMPTPLLLALIRSYNCLPNNADQVTERVLKQLEKRLNTERIEQKEKEQENTHHIDDNNDKSTQDENDENIESPSAHRMPSLPPFQLKLDLSSQMGKFLLSAVDLPEQILQAHPAFQVLKKKDESLVL